MNRDLSLPGSKALKRNRPIRWIAWAVTALALLGLAAAAAEAASPLDGA
jgi:hypothetical protein